MTTLHGGFFVQSCFVRASGHFLYASTQIFSSFDELANGWTRSRQFNVEDEREMATIDLFHFRFGHNSIGTIENSF